MYIKNIYRLRYQPVLIRRVIELSIDVNKVANLGRTSLSFDLKAADTTIAYILYDSGARLTDKTTENLS